MVFHTSTPAEQGIPAGAVLSLIHRYQELNTGVHSLIIYRHGKIVTEAYWKPSSAQTLQTVYSASKSFTSTAVGFAVHEGLLSVQDKVVSFFPEIPVEGLSENTRKMTVWNLLTMSTGHTFDPTEAVFAAEDWVNAFLHIEPQTEPGSLYVYNTAATYMLSAIVQKLTGRRIFDYLKPRFFEPLGLADSGMYWDDDPKGICQGGVGLHCTARDLLTFGVCYLNRGLGIIPEDWVKEASNKQIATSLDNGLDWRYGYGYQLWRGSIPDSFRADGAFGQFSLVLPNEDMVIAINSATADTQKVLDATWEMVRRIDTVDADEAKNQKALERLLAELDMKEPVESGSLPAEYRDQYFQQEPVWGICSVGFDENSTLLFTDEGYAAVPLSSQWKEIKLPGFMPLERPNKLLPVAQPFDGRKLLHLYACAGWKKENCLSVQLLADGWHFHYHLDFVFENSQCTMKASCEPGLEPEAFISSTMTKGGRCPC